MEDDWRKSRPGNLGDVRLAHRPFVIRSSKGRTKTAEAKQTCERQREGKRDLIVGETPPRDRRAAEERRPESPGLPAVVNDPALNSTSTSFINPGTGTRFVAPERPSRPSTSGRDDSARGHRARLDPATKIARSSAETRARSLARSLVRSQKSRALLRARQRGVMYRTRTRDTSRTLATIASSALARGGTRTISSWRYRAASRRPSTPHQGAATSTRPRHSAAQRNATPRPKAFLNILMPSTMGTPELVISHPFSLSLSLAPSPRATVNQKNAR